MPRGAWLDIKFLISEQGSRLALQCLYDEKDLTNHEEELRAIAAKHEGSWIAYLATDTLANAEKNKGVDPKYRPRGYNEGPKE